MKTKFYFVAALAATMLASCADDKFVGDNSPNVVQNEGVENSIGFGSGFKAVTRAGNIVGAKAAEKLNNRFIVGGWKSADGSAYSLVFDNYAVKWVENTAGKTESNTSDWEYVGVTPKSIATSISTAQTIKYWDYSAANSYDFIAYSTGREDDVKDDYETTKVKVTAIDHANRLTAAYKLWADRAQLLNCYIADMVTVPKANYGEEVQLAFRALASKVRMAIYETVPGYSVQNVKFYTKEVNPDNLGKEGSPLTNITNTAALIGKFSNQAEYTVYFDASKVAHVVIDSKANDLYQTFGTFPTTAIGTSSSTATYAPGIDADANNYTKVLPNETGQVLELAVDYQLVSDDGSTETINVYGATAYVPTIFSQWLANYAYTYIFKISDNTNGWTSTTKTDPKGLFPITFDAIVIDSEEHTQKTITTVASPSITTYQKGHNLAKNEYSSSNGNIYIQVMVGNTLKNDLGTNGHLYKVTGSTSISEATVMDALNIIETGTTGRNGITLTELGSGSTEAVHADITAVPGEDGNNITTYYNGTETVALTTGMVAEFSPQASTTYAYVYDTQTWNGIPVTFATAPGDWESIKSNYYTDKECKINAGSYEAITYYMKDSYIYTAVKESTEPANWSTLYYEDPNGVTKVSDWDATYVNKTVYKKYTVSGKVYGVKVIKIED